MGRGLIGAGLELSGCDFVVFQQQQKHCKTFIATYYNKVVFILNVLRILIKQWRTSSNFFKFADFAQCVKKKGRALRPVARSRPQSSFCQCPTS